MRVEHREEKSQCEKNSREPAGYLCQDVGRLRAENIFCHAAAEGRAESLALGTLHQDHEDHEQGDEHVKDERDIKQDSHGDGQYVRSAAFVKLLLMILILLLLEAATQGRLPLE